MATKTLYLVNSAVNGFGSLQDGGTAPTTAQTTTGWTVAKTASSNFSVMKFNTTQASTTFGTTDTLASATAPSSANGNAWRSQNPIWGSFAAAAWTFSLQFQTGTGTAQQGHPNIQVWKSGDPTGATGAVEIAGEQSGSTISFSAINTTSTSTITWTPASAVNLNNEYLFIVLEWQITTAGSTNSATVFFEVGSGCNIATSTFTSLEMNPHYLARFTQPPVWRFQFYESRDPLPPFQQVGDYIWVISYNTPVPYMPAVQRYYYRVTADASIVIPPQEGFVANPHYLATFTPTKLLVWPFHRQQLDTGVPPPPDSAQPHFVAKYTPAKLTVPAQQYYIHGDAFDIAAEAQPHYLARFTPVKLTVWPFLSSLDTGVPPRPDSAQPHFLSKFVPTRLTVPAWLLYIHGTAFDTGAAETQPHFLGRFSPTTLIQFRYNTWDTGVRPSPDSAQPHFVARFSPTKLTVAGSLYYQGEARDVQVVVGPQPETNTHYLARFTPTKLTVWPFLNSFDSNPLFQQVGDSIWVVSYTTYVPPLTAKILYLNQPALDVPAVVAQPETNPHYPYPYQFAIFKPTKLLVWPLLYQYPALDVIPDEETSINVLTYDIPVPSLQATQLYYFGYQEAKDFVVAPLTTETNPHFVGTFRPTNTFVSTLLRLPLDTGVKPPPDSAQPHYLARFTPVKLTINPFLNSLDTGVLPPPDQAQPHFIAHFTPTRLTVWPFLNSLDTGVPPPPDQAQPHFLARFLPAKSYVWPFLNSLDTGVKPPPDQAQPHFLARFVPAKSYVWPFLNQTDTGVRPPPDQAQPHFLARFTPTRFTVWPFFGQQLDTGVPPKPDSAQPHFIGRFTPTKLFISPFAYQYYPGDLNGVTGPLVETNVHTIGRFTPAQSYVWPFYRQQLDTGVPPPADSAQPHFVGKHAPARLTVPALLYHRHGDAFDIAAETQPHFVGRYTPATLTVPASLYYRHGDAFDIAAEAQPHFIGRFAPTTLKRFAYNTLDTGVPPPPDSAQPHFMARFAPTKLCQFAFNTWDTGVPPQPDTSQPHFIGRFLPVRLSQFAYNTPDIGIQAAETQPHFIGRYRPAQITILAQYRQNGATDFIVFVPSNVETQPHFIGRFTPTKYQSFHFNHLDTLVAPIPTFWATGASRALTAIGIGRALMATGQARSLIATGLPRALWTSGARTPVPYIVDANPHFVGKFKPSSYTRVNYGANG